MIYVLSDIHGNERRFASVLEQISLQPTDKLYILGDVIDRYPGGIRLLETIMAMPNAQMLLGNHEYMMLRAMGVPYGVERTNRAIREAELAHWYRNGGEVTHRQVLQLPKARWAKIVDYLRALPLNINLEVNGTRYKLVHGAPVVDYRPDPRYKDPVAFAVWRRLPADTVFSEGCITIFGHTSTRHYQDRDPMEIWYGNGGIGIDCGCSYPEDPADPLSGYGRLACLRLDDGKAFYSQEPPRAGQAK